MVMAAVEQELRRGGQVFYVHNRVKSIEKRRQWLIGHALQDHGITAKIALAHGQMSGTRTGKGDVGFSPSPLRHPVGHQHHRIRDWTSPP
jgi:transcription-repair coupling factor (superfamily II helicase)